MSSHTRTRARRGEGDRLRADILAATERLLFQTGDVDEVSIRAIAGAVGVTPPAIYLHFADKTELIFAVCSARFDEFGAYIEESAAGIDDPVAAMRARGRAYVRYGLDHPEAYRLLFMTPHAKPDGVDDQDLAGMVAFSRQVRAAQDLIDAGVSDATDAHELATSLWAAVHGITSLLISMPDFDWPTVEPFVERYMELLERGYRRR